MKENVDLTLNRDFGTSNSRSVSFRTKRLNKKNMKINKNFPWNEILIYDENVYESKELFFTGSANEREKKKFYANYDDICDMCGKPTNFIPWSKSGGLCGICNKILENQVFEVPWRNFWVRRR